MAYGYYISLQVDHTAVGGSNSTDFTHAIVITGMTNLKTVANGGKVNNTDGSGRPCDLVFSTANDGTGLLSWEIETYDGTLGNLVAWVKHTTNSSSNDQIYLVAGDAAVNTFQGGSLGAAWATGYGIYHQPNGTSLSQADSSANANDLTATGSPTAAAGQIDGAGDYTGNPSGGSATVYARKAAVLTTLTDNWRMSCWVKPSSVTSNVNEAFMCNGNGASSTGYMLGRRGDGGASNDALVCLLCGVAWKDSGSKLTANTWQHIVLERLSGTATFYLNGSVCPNTFTTAPNTPATQFSIANDNGGHSGAKALIDEVRMDVAKGASWTTAEYNNQSNPAAAESTSNAWWIMGAWTAAAGSYTLALSSGSFALTGEAIALTAQRKLSLGQGSFALTGEAVGLYHGYPLALTFGSFSLTGEPMGLSRAVTLALGQGSFALTGEALALSRTRVGQLGYGSFVLNGQDIILVYSGGTSMHQSHLLTMYVT